MGYAMFSAATRSNMGYWVHYQFHQMRVPVEQAAALEAVHALFQPEFVQQHGTALHYDPTTQVTTYSYIGVTLPPEGFATLIEALRAWRFEAIEHSDGAIELIAFCGDKSGDEAVLFDAIAPFMDRRLTPYINAYQENDRYWRHIFPDGQHRIVPGKVVYADECPDLFPETDR